jgi:ABC-2 type transport system permease protein
MLPIYVGGFAILLLNILLFGICYSVLKSGWKIKN